MYKFFIALCGAFGYIKKILKYKETDQDKFISGLTKCSILLTRKINRPIKEIGLWKWLGNFFGRGIQAATDSVWDHAFLYLGKTKGKHIIIESQEIVCKNNLDAYLQKDIQLEAWSRPLTSKEQASIVREAKKLLGRLYDVTEIIAHVFGTPQIDDLVVCSSFCKRSYNRVESIDGVMPSPGDLQQYFLTKTHWSRKRNNC